MFNTTGLALNGWSISPVSEVIGIQPEGNWITRAPTLHRKIILHAMILELPHEARQHTRVFQTKRFSGNAISVPTKLIRNDHQNRHHEEYTGSNHGTTCQDQAALFFQDIGQSTSRSKKY